MNQEVIALVLVAVVVGGFLFRTVLKAKKNGSCGCSCGGGSSKGSSCNQAK
ncbi:MAG: FeoB-associated Cys-rich membrane protein [Bdellovibrionota bacterium]